jgi:hypothetical protein
MIMARMMILETRKYDNDQCNSLSYQDNLRSAWLGIQASILAGNGLCKPANFSIFDKLYKVTI